MIRNILLQSADLYGMEINCGESDVDEENAVVLSII